MSKKPKRKKAKILLLFLCFVILLGILVIVGSKTALKISYPCKQTELVEKYADEYGIDKNLLYAIIKTESGFDKDAKSGAGAIGLTQMTEDTFNWVKTKTKDDYEFEDLYDPEVSIKYGAYFMKILLNEFDNVPTAVAAYHAGRGQVNKWLLDPDISKDGKTLDSIPFKDTRHYVFKVTKAFNIYTNLYN